VWATYKNLLRADFQLFDEHPVEAVKLVSWTLILQQRGMAGAAS
jgi:hypothetical protein